MALNSNSPISLAATVAELQSGTSLLLEYLDRLEAKFDKREPEVLAFVPEAGRFERLRQQATDLLAQYPDPDNRPPLFGIPIGVKDIFHVDGFVTQAGSKLPPSLFKGPEARSVTLLLQAGALIMGKTVTTEFAYFGPGVTRNPHHPEHTPGGSSSGSAAAVGAGLCLMAFGTQTIGSINRPAAFCGVVGYKPSYDRISRAGVIPLSASLDHIGFFVPTVFDAELLAGLLCYQWQVVVVSRKPVLGIPEGPYLERASQLGVAHFRETCQCLADAGFELKPVSLMPDFDEIYARHNLIVAAEAAQVHATWFAQHRDLYHDKTVELITRGQQVSQKDLAQALEGRIKLRQELTRVMEQYSVDLWISPAAVGPAPKGLDSTGDPVMNLPWTHSGLPTLTLPSGFDKIGLPLGLQLTGPWYRDEVMLDWAADIEPIIRPQ
jgi:Asp-tRNA(Asn)/Glu-tRNA(Gln) amidotransferase A subunit family amidase